MFPVICTVDMDAKSINTFLLETYEGYPETPQDLCIITTKDPSAYTTDEAAPPQPGSLVQAKGGGPMTTPSRPPWTKDVKSVFHGQSVEEVAQAVREGFEGTLIERDYCAVLKVRSVREGTVVVVRTGSGGSGNETGFATVKLPFGEVNPAMGAWSLGEGSLEGAWDGGALG